MTMQSRTGEESTVRAGQGKKLPCRAGQDKKWQSEQDRAGNNNRQSRTIQEMTVRAGQDKKSFQSRTRQELIVRAGQGKKWSPDARRESKARSMVGLVLLLFELYNPALIPCTCLMFPHPYFPDNALILLCPDLPTYSLFSLSLNCYCPFSLAYPSFSFICPHFLANSSPG